MIIKILNVCVLHADIDVIKQKRGEGRVDIHRYSRHVYSNDDDLVEALNTFYAPEDTLIVSHHEKTNSKLHLMRSSCARLFNKEDIILIRIINGGSIRVTIFGIGNLYVKVNVIKHYLISLYRCLYKNGKNKQRKED